MTATAVSGEALWRQCHGAAREQGLAPALAVLRSVPRHRHPGPGGIVLAPADERLPEGSTVLREAALPGGTVVLARVAGTWAAEDTGGAAAGAVWLRLGLSLGLLDSCLSHLGARTSGAETLLRQQMIQQSLAEAATGQFAIQADLAASGGAPAPALVRHLHRAVSDVDRVLLRLLGASGFLAGGPGEVADVSELLAGVYTPAGEIA